jgi:glutathione S-transferase
MMKLYTFGPAFGVPDPSMFCMKGEVLLKMAGTPYTLDHSGFNRAPKGKLPYLDDNGTVIADTTFIRWHLEQRHGFDFDIGLSQAEKGVAWAFEKLVEDNMYWASMSDRWTIPENFDKGPAKFFDAAPALIRPLIAAKVRRDVRRNLKGQGLGRHGRADLHRIATQGLHAISDHLADKPFLMGEKPCGADAAVFGCVSSYLCSHFDGPLYRAAMARPNLIAYRDRAMQLWYPEFRS